MNRTPPRALLFTYSKDKYRLRSLDEVNLFSNIAFKHFSAIKSIYLLLLSYIDHSFILNPLRMS